MSESSQVEEKVTPPTPPVMPPRSFYTTGGTLLPSARSYVTRRADEDLLQHLLEGDFCYVLTSRQMGKSSLMVRTAKALRAAGVKVAILDLTRIGQNLTPEQWYGGLMVRLGSELDLEDELDEYWEDERGARLGPMQRFMSALQEVVLPALGESHLAIFVDEIDSVRSLPFSSDEFFAGIRECYNSRVSSPEFGRVAFCLLGVAQPSDLIKNVNITPFNIGHRIELTDFDEVEAGPLLEGLRGKTINLKIAEAVLRRVLYWTGGHPYLTQRLCDAVGRREGLIGVKEVDQVCEDLFLSSRSREKEDNLIFVRERVLAAREHRAEILDLYGKVLRGEKVRDDDSNATLNPLRLSGLIQVKKGYLQLRNRIYATVFDRQWIVANMPDAELRRQKVAYRRGIVFALAIILPVLALIIALAAVSLHVEREAVLDSYFSATTSAQDAFNVGDYATASTILSAWDPARNPRQLWGNLVMRWWDRTERFTQGRNGLENSFAMRLLRAEQSGESVFRFNGAGSPIGRTDCGAVNAVATTVFNGIPMVAAAGEDSSVSLWSLQQDHKLIAQLQLVYKDNKLQPSPMLPCTGLETKGLTLPGITSLHFSPDGTQLAIATGSWKHANGKGSLVIWNLKDTANPVILGSFQDTADSVDWVSQPNGISYIASSSEDATARMWRLTSSAVSPVAFVDPRHTLKPGAVGGSGANAVALSDGTDPFHMHLLAIGYGDGRLLLYDYQKLRYDGSIQDEKPLYAGIAHVSGIMSMTFLEQKGTGKFLRLVVGSRDGDMVWIDPKPLIDAYRKEDETIDTEAVHESIKLTLNVGQGVLQGVSAAYNDDHTKAWLLISGSNKTVGLWTISPTLHPVSTLYGHSAGVQDAAFCPPAKGISSYDSNCVVSASSDGDVRLWRESGASRDDPHEEANIDDTSDHLVGDGLIFRGQVLGVRFPIDSPESFHQKLVLGLGAMTDENKTHAGVIARFDYGSRPARLEEWPPGTNILGFDISPDGKFSVSTSRTRDLSFLPLTENPSLSAHAPQDISVHSTLQQKIRVRCLSADGKEILTHCTSNQTNYLVMAIASSSDNPDPKNPQDATQGYGAGHGLCLWRVIDHGLSARPRFEIPSDNFDPCESPRKDRQLSARLSGFRTVARRVYMFDIAPNGQVATSSVEADGRIGVAIWRAADLLAYGVPDASYSTDAKDLHGFDSQFVDMSFSPDGKSLAATNILDRMYYWPVQETRKWPLHQKNDHGEVVLNEGVQLPARGQILVFSPCPNDHLLAIGTADARVLLWSTSDNKLMLTIRRHSGGVYGLAFSPDGQTLVSAGNDGRVHILKAASTPDDIAASGCATGQ